MTRRRLARLALMMASVLTFVTCGGEAPTAPSTSTSTNALGGAVVSTRSPFTAADSAGEPSSTATADACTTTNRITSVGLGINMATPKLEVDPVFESGLEQFEVEVERQKNGTWFFWARKTSDPGSSRVNVELWFNQTYRVRVAIVGCPFGDWIERSVGNPNRCGHCGTAGGTGGTVTLNGAIN